MGYRYYKKGLIFLPPHNERELEKKEATSLMEQSGTWFLRNCYNFDKKEQTSFWFVIKDHFGGMEELSTKTRNLVRRAFKTLDIRIVPQSFICENGYKVYAASFARYGGDPCSEEVYQKQLTAGDFQREYWACLEKETGQMVAYAENLLYVDMCEYSSLKAIPEYMSKYYPYYGLLYAMNQYYLLEKKLKYVNDGARTLTEHSNIQTFLEDKFLFRKAYCDLKIYYVPWLRILIGSIFPFRKWIPVKSINAFLRQEAMARGMIE